MLSVTGKVVIKSLEIYEDAAYANGKAYNPAGNERKSLFVQLKFTGKAFEDVQNLKVEETIKITASNLEKHIMEREHAPKSVILINIGMFEKVQKGGEIKNG